MLAASFAFALYGAPGAWAAITNTVIATGKVGSADIAGTAAESVDVVNQIATVTLDKQAVLNDANNNGLVDAGDTIAYTFITKNTGNVTLKNVVLVDTKVTPSLPTLSDVAPNADSTDGPQAGWDKLAPGDTLTSTASYTLTQADIDAGTFTNKADISATTIPGLSVQATDTVVTDLSGKPSMTLEKSGLLALGSDNKASVGDQITYTFTVKNTGPTTISNVTINDPMLVADLPNAARVNELVQLAAIPVDTITTASISSTTPEAGAREPEPALPMLPAEPAALHAERKLVNLSTADQPLKAGDRVGVYFTLVNTGNVPLTNISVIQPGDQAFGSNLDILPVNTTDNATLIFTHVLTEEDIQTSQVDFVSGIIATARNTPLFVTLSGPLSLLDIEQPTELATASISPTSISTLAPNATATFTATYNISQADIDAGTVHNDASAGADGVTDGPSASADVSIPQAPLMTLDKTSSLDISKGNLQKADAGDEITYTFVLTNTGNVTIHNVQITDAPLGIVVPAAPIQDFAPGDSQTFTATYALKPTDVAAHQVVNQATASGVYGSSNTPASQVSNDPNTPAANDATITPLPAIALVKHVASITDTNNNGFNDAGDVVHYQFTVTNLSSVPLTNVHVVDRDPLVVSNIAPGSGITLGPNATDSTSLTAQYTLLQADVTAGGYDNTADAYGTTPDNKVVTDESDPLVPTADAPTHLPIDQIYRVAVLKPAPVVSNDTNGITDLNDVLTYTITVINTGNMPLTNVLVKDPVAGNFQQNIASLAVGGSVSLTASHTVSAADMTAGEVRNTAAAEIKLPDNSTFVDKSDTTNVNEDDPTITALVPRAAIAVVKGQPQILDSDNSGTTNAGDVLRYTFAITNTGNVDLTNIQFNDILTGTYFTTFSGTLEAGDTDTTTQFDYPLTAADLLAGKVTNRVTVSADGPGTLTANDSSHPSSQLLDGDTVTYVGAPRIAIIKSGTYQDFNGNNLVDAGDRVIYAFTVQNMGSQPLTNVMVSDTKATVSPSTPISLAAGATTTVFTGIHTISQAELNAGFVQNQATVEGFFGATRVSDDSHPSDFGADGLTTTPLSQAPAIALIKAQPTNSDENGNGIVEPGETLTYHFTVTNTGNVTLNNLTIADTNAPDVLGSLATLAPGASNSTAFTTTHLVTEADATAEKFENQAEVTAVVGAGPDTVKDLSHPTSNTGAAFTVTPVSPRKPVLTKAAGRSQVRRGEQVPYTITATNLSAGTFDIADIMPAGFSFVEGSATVNGAAFTPAQSGNTLAFANLAANAQGRIIVKLNLLASTTLSTGEFINRARIFSNATGTLLAEARAAVRITEEHVFDCGEIIGRVFDDVNNNGYMDDGEVGLPGVRVATVKGLLVTTDKFGRFHVTCADVPNAQIGSNFLMKVDTRTLPGGYALTTENPRDVRLTRGKITKLNFGASKRRAVALDLTRDAFTSNSTELKPQWQDGLDRLVGLLSQSRGALTITYRCGEHAPIADDRVAAVEAIIQAKWMQEGGKKPLNITTRVECGK